MDSNLDKVNHEKDDPVFKSTDLAGTKARSNTAYFTNVQKATLGQKISNWFAKVNRESSERSKARQAAIKSKLEERRRAADIAAVSISIPTATAAQAPQTTPAPAPTVTQPAQKSNRKTLAALLVVLVAVIILAIVALLLIFKPWVQPEPVISETGVVVELTNGPVESVDMATISNEEAIAFRSMVLYSTNLNVYADSLESEVGMVTSASIVADNIDKVLALNNITDPAAILLFDIEKARVYIIYEDYDAAWDILGEIDEDSLYESQKGSFYSVMQDYFYAQGELEKAKEYQEKYAALPVFNGGA